MIRIAVKAEVSETHTRQYFDLEDLNMTQEEWDSSSEDEKQTALQIAIDNSGDQPCWAVTDWREETTI